MFDTIYAVYLNARPCSISAANCVCLATQVLLDECNTDRIVLDATVASVSPGRNEVVMEDGTKLKARVVVGADGERSRVAEGLGVRPANFVGQIGFRGVAEFGDGPSAIAPRHLCQVRASCMPQMLSLDAFAACTSSTRKCSVCSCLLQCCWSAVLCIHSMHLVLHAAVLLECCTLPPVSMSTGVISRNESPSKA